MAQFCSTFCTTNTAVRLASQPCATCPDNPTQPPPTPGPVEEEFNEPPTVNSLDPVAPQFFIAGSGIPAEFATVATNSVIELFLAPIIGNVEAAGPSVDGAYDIALAPGQELAVLFGATILAPFKITTLYDVDLTVTAGGDSMTLALAVDNTAESGYKWTDGAAYNIVDSDGNAQGTTVQNVTRLRFLVDGGLLPPAAEDPGLSTWVLTATPKAGGPAVVATVNVTTSV